MATRIAAASVESDECEDRDEVLSPALKKKKAKKKSRKPISIFTNGHPLVKLVSDKLNWDDVERDDDWSVAWIDGRVIDKAWYGNTAERTSSSRFAFTCSIVFSLHSLLSSLSCGCAQVFRRYIELRPMQRVNHFPGIEYLAKKKSLGRLLNAMKEKFPDDFTFYPKTFLLPEEYALLFIYYYFFFISAIPLRRI